MTWLVAPIVALTLSSIVAYIIYEYRALVILKLVSIHRGLSFNGDILVVDDYYGEGLSFSLITITNYGFKNVKDFVFSAKEGCEVQDYRILDTSSIDYSSISISSNDGYLKIACPYLPKREKIEIELVTNKKPTFWTVRGHGDQYRLESDAFHQGYRKALSVFLWVLSFGTISSLSGALCAALLID